MSPLGNVLSSKAAVRTPSSSCRGTERRWRKACPQVATLPPCLPPAPDGPARLQPSLGPSSPRMPGWAAGGPVLGCRAQPSPRPAPEGGLSLKRPLSPGHMRAVRGDERAGVRARGARAVPPAVRGAAAAGQLHRGRRAAADPAGQGEEERGLCSSPQDPRALQVGGPPPPLPPALWHELVCVHACARAPGILAVRDRTGSAGQALGA